MRNGSVRSVIDIQYDHPGIPQAVNECRQEQWSSYIYANAPEKEYRSIQDQETEM